MKRTIKIPTNSLSRIGIVLIVLFCSGCTNLENTIHFGICSDVHKDIMHDADERLDAFVEEMTNNKVDFILQLGDFCRPYDHNDSFMSIWNSFPGSKYHVLGNHDMDGGFTREQTVDYFNMPAKYYSFDMNGFHFIILDGNDKRDPPQAGYAHFIGDLQKTWLANDLASNDLPAVVFSHQSLGGENSVENGAEIRSMFEKHNKEEGREKIIACFNGHNHFDGSLKINGIWYVEINSMSYQWLGNDYLHVRYCKEIDEKYPWVKYTAPYRNPIYADVRITTDGTIRIQGKSSEWVGPSPWDLGYPDKYTDFIKPEISDQLLDY